LRRLEAALLALALAGCATTGDSWGRDKFLHFAAGAAVATAVRSTGGDDADAVFVAVSVGAVKEGCDASSGGDASWWDLLWTALGGAAAAIAR